MRLDSSHLNKQEIQAVLRKMLAALKADGIIYTSLNMVIMKE